MPLPSESLTLLGLTLPAVAKPVGAYTPALREGNLIFLSGQLPLRDGQLAHTGKAGSDRTLEQAQEAARLCTLGAIAAAADVVGSVDQLRRAIKVVVYVASSENFTDQHLVANGASELLGQIFPEAGPHARAAVGVAELPLNATVEVDVTFTV
jgi:enamine deaminase RidA (YjgF/YER057c/UK114 family)